MRRFNRDMVRKYGAGFLEKLNAGERRILETLKERETEQKKVKAKADKVAAKELSKIHKKAIKKGSFREDDPRADDRISWTVKGR